MPAIVLDTSPLSHFSRAKHLDTLAALTADYDCFVTRAVIDELDRGTALHPRLSDATRLEWLTVVRVDGLAELQAFAEYARRLGSGGRDIGEASTLAWAETHRAIAILDERAGTRHGKERGVEVHGTLWLVADAVRTDRITAEAAETLIDGLRDVEAWFPRFEDGFVVWAQANGLL